MDKKIQYGQFFTTTNPFDLDIFYKWADFFKNDTKSFLEPFAGANNIVRMINDLGFSQEWVCYDIQPPTNEEINGYVVNKRDTIVDYPSGVKVAITNPPYLAKNSAIRKKMNFPNSKFDDLYKIAVDVMLQNTEYVAAIIPESFITSELFHDRVYAVISLTCKMFDDTDCPVCLALFVPKSQKDSMGFKNDFWIYRQNILLGRYQTLKREIPIANVEGVQWKFNDVSGTVGIKCIDDSNSPSIRFIHGDEVPNSKIKVSSRSLTKVSGLPKEMNLEDFLNICNEILNQYRNKTSDVFLTSFKGLRKDGCYRRRLDFKTAKNIMSKALQQMIKQENTNYDE